METRTKLSNFWKFTLAILLCEGIGISSVLLASASNNVWFDSLVKPTWNPPAYLFGPVWTTLYLLMGIALGIVWKHNAAPHKKRRAYYLFSLQLLLNFWWSILFFKFHSPVFALLDIGFLVLLIIMTIVSFTKFSKTAAWLLFPYLAWV